ncbi:uncharacterized protein LOC132869046 [Neoarius graeffei]|uniref:uncharacterized protein LOC132869046 n=1 Tax=Neoarius graeffei TaxID=443677 RepID=UPI00298C4469|nr:uncharacterized protein LOC132869046 [Neoarius graeffei]
MWMFSKRFSSMVWTRAYQHSLMEKMLSAGGQMFDTGRYPALTKTAQAALSVFHGPLIESSFSYMSEIIDSKSGSMSISTLSAIQTVKHTMLTQKKTAVEMFNREDIKYGPVDQKMCQNILSAGSKDKALRKQAALKEMERRRVSDCQPSSSAAAARRTKAEEEALARRRHAAKQRKRACETLVQAKKKKNECFSKKNDDLENRSRRSNLRIIGLEEKAEGVDAESFLENWLTEVLGAENFPHPLRIERAHCIAVTPPGSSGKQKPATERPRPLIAKFLNFKDKVRVMNAVRKKKAIMYNNRQVKFFSDFSSEVQRQRNAYYAAKQTLHSKGIEYSLQYPAKLRVTYLGKDIVFQTPGEVDKFLHSIDDESISESE